jgi:hypothetical protein
MAGFEIYAGHDLRIGLFLVEGVSKYQESLYHRVPSLVLLQLWLQLRVQGGNSEFWIIGWPDAQRKPMIVRCLEHFLSVGFFLTLLFFPRSMALLGEDSSNLASGVVVWSVFLGALVLWMLSSFCRRTKQQRESFLVPSCSRNAVYR